MVALGCEGGPALWDDRAMEDGIHLRWMFRPELGYPLGGFDLYRRSHEPGDPICTEFKGPLGTSYSSPWQLDADHVVASNQPLKIISFLSTAGNIIGLGLNSDSWIRIAFSQPVNWLSVGVASNAPITARAYHDAVSVAQAKSQGTGGKEKLILEADAIEAVELNHAQGVVFSFCEVPVSQMANGGTWKLLTPTSITLPVTHAKYPVQHAHAPDDMAEAQSRVPPDTWSRYSVMWNKFHNQLQVLVDDKVSIPMAALRETFKEQGAKPTTQKKHVPELEILPLQQTLAASLDHNIARMLGLYWLDDTVEPGRPYDYMIVGHWKRAGRTTCPTASRVDFSKLQGGTHLGTVLTHQSVTFFSPLGDFAVLMKTSPWNTSSQERVLHVGAYTVGAKSRVFISFPQTLVEAQAYVQTASVGAQLRAYHNGAQVSYDVSNQKNAVLIVKAKAIDYAELIGDDVYLFSLCFVKKENETGDRRWIVFNVKQTVPSPLSAPIGTKAVCLPGMMLPQDDGSFSKGSNQLAIRWDLPVEQNALEPGRAVMYSVQRQYLGKGASPEAIDPGKFSLVTADPVLVTASRTWNIVDEGTASKPSQWVLEGGELLQKSNIFEPYQSIADLPMRGTYAVAGRLEWSDYRLRVGLRSDDDNAIGVLFRYQDEKNYYRFSMDSSRQYRRLVKCRNGIFSLLWYDKTAFTQQKSYQLEIVVKDAALKVVLDGSILFEGPDQTKGGALTHGRVGLYCWGNDSARFQYVQVSVADTPARVFFEDDFKKSVMTRLPAGWPSYPVYVLDQGREDGWYAYRSAGIDIFGRVSDDSAPFITQALDKTPPPAPLVIEAKALQARPSDATDSVVDQMLTPMEKDWLKKNPAGGILVRWLWPGELRCQAPDAAEYRVYLHPGQFNTISGAVTSVLPGPKGYSVLTTDQSTTLCKDALKDEWVRVGAHSFKVIGNGTGANFTVTVKNLVDPEPSPSKKTKKEVLPVCAPFSLTISKKKPHYINFRDPRKWQKRLHVEPAAMMSLPSGKISKCVKKQDNIYELSTDGELLDPSTTYFPNGRAVAGALVSDGRMFRALKHTTGKNIHITINALGHIDSPILPKVKSAFTYYPGINYCVIMPGLPFVTADAEPIAYAQLGVSTADNKTHTKEAPPPSGAQWGSLGGRQGNEGSVSSQQTVFVIERTRPGQPTGAADSKNVYALPADYYGHSKFTLSWPREQNDNGLFYQVYRAIDESLFNSDQKKPKPNRPIVKPKFLSQLRWQSVKAELIALDQGTTSYNNLSNDALQTLASLTGNEVAFSLLTPEPLDPSNTKYLDPSNSQVMRFTDMLNGRSRNRHFYRIAVVDRGGNRSALAESTPPIYTPDTTPPRAPRPIQVLGGEKKVHLKWQANSESGMDHYLIYRTTDPSQAEDIRLMGDPVKKLGHQSGTVNSFIDEGLPGPLTYYYRLVAVRKGTIGPQPTDVIELFSPATETLAVRNYDPNPPDPPTWTHAKWVKVDANGTVHPWNAVTPAGLTYTPAVALEWASKEPYRRWIVQRKVWKTNMWQTISTWLSASNGKGSLIDQSARSDEDYVYRIRGEDVSGRTNLQYKEKTVPKAVVAPTA